MNAALQSLISRITAPPQTQSAALQAKLDSRTKPQGSLGKLEALAHQIGCIQDTVKPQLSGVRIAVFAGDHGAALAGVSAFPQAVTAQMVANFCAGGAAINVLARQAGAALSVVDAGVVGAPCTHTVAGVALIQARIAEGTANYLQQAAMSAEQAETAVLRGASLVQDWHAAGCRVLALGEMGIGNTASASLLTHALTGQPLTTLIGRGTGLDDAGLTRKRAALQQAWARGGHLAGDAMGALAQFGGFEIAMLTGAYLAAADLKIVIVVDGFIATAALLLAHALAPAVLDYCVFSHCSAETGHRLQLAYLGVEPVLNLDLRLGEASGAALALPLLHAAVALLNEMTGFTDAGVAEKTETHT